MFLLCVTDALFRGAGWSAEATAEGEKRSNLLVLRGCSINILNPSDSFQVLLYLLASLKTCYLNQKQDSDILCIEEGRPLVFCVSMLLLNCQEEAPYLKVSLWEFLAAKPHLATA